MVYRNKNASSDGGDQEISPKRRPKMVRACCECIKLLEEESKHLSIIGCYGDDDVSRECVDCQDREMCTIRLVYPADASHGLCDTHFKKAMETLTEKRRKASGK